MSTIFAAVLAGAAVILAATVAAAVVWHRQEVRAKRIELEFESKMRAFEPESYQGLIASGSMESPVGPLASSLDSMSRVFDNRTDRGITGDRMLGVSGIDSPSGIKDVVLRRLIGE